MIGRLVLVLLQVVAAWAIGPIVRAYVPTGGDLDLFVYAAIFAVIVYLTGVLASLVIRNVGRPSFATLAASLVLAVIGAAFAKWGMDLIPQLPNTTISNRGIVLAGAVLGYFLRR